MAPSDERILSFSTMALDSAPPPSAASSEQKSESFILHRTPLPPPVAVSGEGSYIILEDGKKVLDAVGGAAVACIGYSHPKVKQAIKDQLDKLSCEFATRLTSETTLKELQMCTTAKCPTNRLRRWRRSWSRQAGARLALLDLSLEVRPHGCPRKIKRATNACACYLKGSEAMEGALKLARQVSRQVLTRPVSWLMVEIH